MSTTTTSSLEHVECNNRKRILIVDNDEKTQRLLQRTLEDMGFETLATWSGYEALGLLASGRLDVLLVDDYMPDLHFHDFLARVGRLPTQPCIVVMQAASPTRDEVRRYAMLGATNVVRKHHAEVSKAVSSCCIDYSLAKIYVN